MDRIAVSFVFVTCLAGMAGMAAAAPIESQDLTSDNEVADTDTDTTSGPNAGSLVIVAREEEEEEELLPSQSSGVYYGGEQQLIASPVLLVEDDVDVLGGELMETANSGLVFRPQFRYRKQSRRRYNRNTRRRYGSPLFFGLY